MPYPWPNNPVELTAHSVRFFGYFLHFLLYLFISTPNLALTRSEC